MKRGFAAGTGDCGHSAVPNSHRGGAAARTFRVPTEVDSSGRVYLPSHIKLQRVGSPAPRMHFLDDAGGATGRIWIGYLGDHLPNTRTN